MLKEKRIYCIEGVWDYEDEVEPSVEPMLELLRRQGLWNYVRRDCATSGELKYYLKKEWKKTCKRGSVLYLATHGDWGRIWLDKKLKLDDLGNLLKGRCKDRLVHFGGCCVLGDDDDDEDKVTQRVKKFLDKTKAMGVSGYGTSVDWADAQGVPALALELLLFSSISEHGASSIDLTNEDHFNELSNIAHLLRGRFSDCKFDLYTRTDPRILE